MSMRFRTRSYSPGKGVCIGNRDSGNCAMCQIITVETYNRDCMNCRYDCHNQQNFYRQCHAPESFTMTSFDWWNKVTKTKDCPAWAAIGE